MGNGTAPQPLLQRAALAEQLATAAASQICVMVAAAGWGKTTAMRSWPFPTAWVHPAGPEDFAAGLMAALAAHVPGSPPAAHTAGNPPAFAAAVCDWMAASLRHHLTVVVDDVHELPAGSGAARIVEGLCRHAAGNLHVVLLSRRELPFSLCRLLGRGLVTELHAAELAFGLGEVAGLLQESVGKCSPELTMHVRERTAGWPVATLRAVELLRGVPEDERIDVLGRLARAGERFHGYLREEVIDAEPPATRDLLRWLAVFGAVRPATVASTGVPEAPALLADLERRGLVRRAYGSPDRWELVRPLQDYFDQEPVLPAAERAALHRAAAAAYADRGAFATALRHATAAGDHAACAALLVEHGASLVNSGEMGTVLAAAALPSVYLEDPRIQRVLGQALLLRGQWERAHECFLRAGRDQPESDPVLAWRLGLIAYNRAEYGEVVRLGEHVRPGGAGRADADAPDRARLLALAAMARLIVGDTGNAHADAERAMAIAQRCADPAALAAGHAALAALAVAEGDRRRADAHCATALEAAQDADDMLQVLMVRVQRAAILCEMGRLHEALAEADAAVELGERCENAQLVAQARTVRAAAQARLGTLEQAIVDFTAARDVFQRIGSRLLVWPLCGLGDVHRVRGQLARARAAYEQALALAEPGRDRPAMGSALVGLARVRAADDPVMARELAERAVGLGEGTRQVAALLARGWVTAVAGDRARAAEDAGLAAAAARQRRDDPGLAEALLLGALCTNDQNRRDRALVEAIHIWQETGHRVEEAVAHLVASRVGATASGLSAAFAVETLRTYGVDVRAPRPAGPLAVLARSAPSLSIQVLGMFQVIRDGMPVPRTAWQSRKARQLLKILIARRGRPVQRERLMELLWPETDPTRAGNRLSVLLSALRDVLQPGIDHAEPGPLMTDSGGVWLDYGQVDVDVERFLNNANAALEAHRRRQPDAMARLIAAEAAHTGEFLEDDPYQEQEWAASLTEEVRATHVALLRTLVQRLRTAGEVDDVVRYSLRLLDKDRYDEQAHLDLVDVLQAAGRHGEARRRYRMYLRAMAELGVPARPFHAEDRTRIRRSG